MNSPFNNTCILFSFAPQETRGLSLIQSVECKQGNHQTIAIVDLIAKHLVTTRHYKLNWKSYWKTSCLVPEVRYFQVTSCARASVLILVLISLILAVTIVLPLKILFARPHES